MTNLAAPLPALSALRVAEEAEIFLRESGDVSLEYITAEFEPYSSAQRPDVVFVPGSGPNAGSVFFSELRLSKLPSRALLPPELMAEHRNFIQSDLEPYLFFSLATSISASEDTRSALAQQDVTLLDGIRSGADLATRLIQWAASATRPDSRN